MVSARGPNLFLSAFDMIRIILIFPLWRISVVLRFSWFSQRYNFCLYAVCVLLDAIKRSQWPSVISITPQELYRAGRSVRLLFSNASPETPASFRSVLIRPQCEVSVYKRCFISWCGGSKNRPQTSLKRHEAVPERTGRTWVSRPPQDALWLWALEKQWITLWWNWDGADRADLPHLPGCR